MLQHAGITPLTSYRAIAAGYGLLSVVLLLLFSRLTSRIEVTSPAAPSNQAKRGFGLHRSRSRVLKLSALFMLDAFAGGLVIQSVIVYWFQMQFGVSPEALGSIFFGANLLAGVSALAAGRLAARFGLINTMVWTHLPSNLLLMLVPLMPTLPLATIILLIRFSISQMDVPTRQAYTMAVVDPDERSAAAGFTTMTRTVASAFGPLVTGVLFNFSLFSVPFLVAGVLKITYDLTLYHQFRALDPPEN
jgi:predicted MFS family arabinose efflux permease